jgi:hypothetical protein
MTQFQPVIDELNTSALAISQVVSDLKAQVANAPNATDVADTQAALQTAADAVKAAVGQ